MKPVPALHLLILTRPAFTSRFRSVASRAIFCSQSLCPSSTIFKLASPLVGKPRTVAVPVEPDEPAVMILLDKGSGIIGGAIVHYNDLEMVIFRGQRRFQAFIYGSGAVSVGNDNRNEGSHGAGGENEKAARRILPHLAA